MHIFNKVFLFLFGLAFSGFGIYLLMDTSVPALVSWQEMKNWHPAGARLISVEGKENKTEARYRYEVEGITHESSRVYVAGFNDSIGNYHKELSRKLKKSLEDNEEITIYYNPASPAHSIIDRDMRWGLFTIISVFCSVFILIGGFICYGVIISKTPAEFTPPPAAELKREWERKKKIPGYRETFSEFRQHRLHELKQADKNRGRAPSGAWQKKDQWHTSHIRSTAKSGFRAMYFFALVCLGVSSPVLFFFMDEWNRGNHAILAGLIFPLAGLFLLFKAISLTREYLHYGIIEYVMDPYPGAIGGQVGGWLDLKKNYDLNTEYRIELSCIFSFISGTGEDRTRQEIVKWSQQGAAKKEFSRNSLRLLFVFDVPEGLPEADIDQTADTYCYWQLGLTDMSGNRLSRKYNIPVFATGQTAEKVTHNLTSQMHARQQRETEQLQQQFKRGNFLLPPGAGPLRISETPSGLRLLSPMFRNKLLTFFLILFGGCSGAVSYGLIHQIHGFTFSDIIFGIVSFPFVIFTLLMITAAIYIPLNSLTAVFAGREITVTRRLLLIPVGSRTMAIEEVKGFEVKRTGSTGQGTTRTEHYKIVAVMRKGKEIAIAESINGRDVARQIKAFLHGRITGY